MLKNFLLALIPLFAAVDAVGVLPIFVSLTEGLTQKEKSRIILQSMFTASALAIGFILVGKAVFRLLGITVADFMIAGRCDTFLHRHHRCHKSRQKAPNTHRRAWGCSPRHADDCRAGCACHLTCNYSSLRHASRNHIRSGKHHLCRLRFQNLFLFDAVVGRNRF